MVKGDLAHQTKEFHAKYGNIVRTAPDELSFTHESAYRDIYAYRAGHQSFPKSLVWNSMPDLGRRGPPKKPDQILNANDADHSRIRKLFSHPFSDKALTEQEPLIRSYVDLLIQQLRKQVQMSRGCALDMSKWYNFTTFDIIGDLGWGESFDCLKDTKYHSWVAMILSQFKAATLGLAMQYYPAGRWFMQNWIPQSLIDDVLKHSQFTEDKVRRRLNLKVDRADFLSEVLKHNDEKGMTVEEIVETSDIIIVTGSETTATTLSGITSYLVKSPDVMAKLVQEIRQNFKNESLITSSGLSKLPYLNAVIQEGLRLCPPVPDGFRRDVPPKGDTISGEWLPEGVSRVPSSENMVYTSRTSELTCASMFQTVVKFSLWAAFVSPSNFARPTEFLPERWLPKDPASQSDFDNDNRKVFHPFGLGSRNCIGQNLAWMELRLILGLVLWNFNITVPIGSSGLDLAKLKTFRLWEKKTIDVILTPA